MLKKLLFVLSVPVLVLFGTTAVAQAANYHFVGDQSCVRSADTVTCSFSVAGLGNATKATAHITAPYYCAKITNGQQYVQPGGLADSGNKTYAVRNGRVDVVNLALTAHCPDHFTAHFTGPVNVYVNNVLVGTIPIT